MQMIPHRAQGVSEWWCVWQCSPPPSLKHQMRGIYFGRMVFIAPVDFQRICAKERWTWRSSLWWLNTYLPQVLTHHFINWVLVSCLPTSWQVLHVENTNRWALEWHASSIVLGSLWLAGSPLVKCAHFDYCFWNQCSNSLWCPSLTTRHMVRACQHFGHPAELCDSRDVPALRPHPLLSAGNAHTRTHIHTYTLTHTHKLKLQTNYVQPWDFIIKGLKSFALIFSLLISLH